MKPRTLAKLAGVAVAGAVIAGGLNAAGAIPGPLNNGNEGELPEPAQQGQTFATAMLEWADCVGDAAAAHDPATGAFDPVAACGERPDPADFDEIGEPEIGSGVDAADLPEGAQAGQAFAAAMQEWAACVGEAAAAHRDSDENSGRFDPFEACGEQPHPSDFGIGGGPPDSVPAGPPESTPGGGRPTGTPSGPPESTPAGSPAGVPAGPPAGIPSGPPDDPGPPEGVPAGPPEGVPGGGA